MPTRSNAERNASMKELGIRDGARSQISQTGDIKLGSRGSTSLHVLGFGVFVFCCGTGFALGDSTQPLSPTNIFAPASTPAKSIFGLSLFVLSVTGAIFAVVFALLLYSVVKFRKRKNDDGREPPQVYGSNRVELAWTIIPILIVVALFMATARVIATVQRFEVQRTSTAARRLLTASIIYLPSVLVLMSLCDVSPGHSS